MSNKTKKNRKGPNISATQCAVGKIKRGNDGNKWIVVKTKNGVKRWKKQNKQTQRRRLPRLNRIEDTNSIDYDKLYPNKELHKFWKKLAEGHSYVIIYKNNQKPKTENIKNLSKNKLNELLNGYENDSNVKAVLSSCRSYDCYLMLLKRAKMNTVEHVINNYKTYFKPFGLGKQLSPF